MVPMEEFILNFMRQRRYAPSGHFSFYNIDKNYMVTYLHYCEFMIIDKITGNEFIKNKSVIYTWLKNGPQMNSFELRNLLIGLLVNTEKFTIEFFSFGFAGYDVNSRKHIQLREFTKRILVPGVQCFKGEFEKNHTIEFEGVLYLEKNIIKLR